MVKDTEERYIGYSRRMVSVCEAGRERFIDLIVCNTTCVSVTASSTSASAGSAALDHRRIITKIQALGTAVTPLSNNNNGFQN